MLGALRHAATLRFAAAGSSLNARSGARLRLAWNELAGVAPLSIGAYGGPPLPRPARQPAHAQAAARAKVRPARIAAAHACAVCVATARTAVRSARGTQRLR